MENIKEITVSQKTNIENVIYTCIKYLEKKKEWSNYMQQEMQELI